MTDRRPLARSASWTAGQEAHLHQPLRADAAPEGHTHWTLPVVGIDKVVELEFAESISLRDGAPDTQKNELKPWKKKEWCIPKVSGEFVAPDGRCAGLVPPGVQSVSVR